MEEKKGSHDSQEQNLEDEFYTAAVESEDSQSDTNSQDEEIETFQTLLKANEKRYMRLFKTLSAKKYPR